MNSEELYITVGQRIRMLREERHLTQEELATLVALARTSITNIESGRQKLLLHTLYDIAIALAVEPTHLLPKVPDTPQQELPADLPDAERDWIRSIIATPKKGE